MKKKGMNNVFKFSEGRGMYTKGIGEKNHAIAVKVMREYAFHERDLDPEAWSNNPNQAYDPNDVTEDTVVATRYYTCKSCDISTIGDENLCVECNEPCGTVGRHTFAFFAI